MNRSVVRLIPYRLRRRWLRLRYGPHWIVSPDPIPDEDVERGRLYAIERGWITGRADYFTTTENQQHLLDMNTLLQRAEAAEESYRIGLRLVEELRSDNKRLRSALQRIYDWRGFSHTGEVRDCALQALGESAK